MKSLFYVLLTGVLASSGTAAIIHVPADQPTIQAGIDAATNLDTVEVAAGTYTGDGNRDIDFGGKNILLRSAAGAASTIIDCQGSQGDPHVGIWFHTNEDTLATVDGFTITGAWKKLDPPWDFVMAGGIVCQSSTPTIRHCIFTANSGAGLVSHIGGHPYVYGCTFSQNYGHGIRAGSSNITGSGHITVERCLVLKNDSIGICLLYVGNHFIRNCTVVQNGKDGIRYFADLPVAAKGEGSGAYVQSIERCIIAFNKGYGFLGSTLGFPDIPVQCSDVYQNSQGDYWAYRPDTTECVSLDPQFCDTAVGDYLLRDNSPCTPLLSPCRQLIGALPIGCLCCDVVTGNINGTGIIDLNDLSQLIAYLIGGSRTGICPSEADININGMIDLTDLSVLIYYLTGMDGYKYLLPCPVL